MSLEMVAIDDALMREVFPFHIAFDRDLKVIQTGRALSRLMPEVQVGTALGDVLQIVTPNVPLDFERILDQSYTVFFVKHSHSAVMLKGQMVHIKSADEPVMVFLCNPVVRDMPSVGRLGLTLNDFAVHDSVVDFLVLLQTKGNALNDVREMTKRLKEEVKVRKRAQHELQLANEWLEHRVQERTEELVISNEDLQEEIVARRAAQELSEQRNVELKITLRKVEQQNHEIRLLNRMGDMLQACHSIKETHRVICESVSQLFPGTSGELALFLDERGAFEVVANWGSLDTTGRSFGRTDCWAIRRARSHAGSSSSANESRCAHIDPDDVPALSICMPLSAQNHVLGLLHMRCAESSPPCDDVQGELGQMETRRALLQTAAEHIGLAVANLKLRESLRRQSIRDPLTGLYNRRYMEEALVKEGERAVRERRSVGIIMLDVDHFKKFNDNYGHKAGDALLKELGALLQRQVREADIACRYGGEEFMLILPGASLDATAARAERVRFNIEKHLKVVHDQQLLPQVTASLGVATIPLHSRDAQKVIAMADAALYNAKHGGRNRVAVAEVPINPPMLDPGEGVVTD